MMPPDREAARELIRAILREREQADALARRYPEGGYYTRTGHYRRPKRRLMIREEPSSLLRLWRAMTPAQRNAARAGGLFCAATALDAVGLWLAAGFDGLAGSLILTLALIGPGGILR